MIMMMISIDFVYTQWNVETVLYYTIQFCINTASMSKTVPLHTITITMLFKCKYTV